MDTTVRFEDNTSVSLSSVQIFTSIILIDKIKLPSIQLNFIWQYHHLVALFHLQ